MKKKFVGVYVQVTISEYAEDPSKKKDLYNCGGINKSVPETKNQELNDESIYNRLVEWCRKRHRPQKKIRHSGHCKP